MHESITLQRERVIHQLSAGETATALDALVTDLAPSSTALVPVKRLRVLLGSIERYGAWDVPSRLEARVLWGNLELDLREARLAAGVTTIDVHVTMGNVEVLVPPGVAVEVDAGAVLAHVEDRTEPSTAATRVVRVVGQVRLGNLEVTTLLRGETKRDARRRRRGRSARRRLEAAAEYVDRQARLWR